MTRLSFVIFFLYLSPIFSYAQNLVTIGSRQISTQEFKERLTEISKQSENPPTPESFLEDLIRYEIGVQEAEKLGLQNDPLVKERYRQVLYNSLLEKKLGKSISAITVNEKEMKNYYKSNPEIQLAHILIEIKPSSTPQEREMLQKRANDAFKAVKAGRQPFGDLVRQYSDDSHSKDSDGDLGFQNRMTLPSSLYSAAVGLKVGEVKGPIETQFGFHIIKLLAKQSYEMSDKRPLRIGVFDQKRAQIFNDYFSKTKRGYKIVIDKKLLKDLKK